MSQVIANWPILQVA